MKTWIVGLLVLIPLLAHAQQYGPEVTNAVGTDLMLVQTNSIGPAGQKFSRSITISNLARVLSDFLTIGTGSGIQIVKSNGVNLTTSATALDFITGSNSVLRLTNIGGVVHVQVNASASGVGNTWLFDTTQFATNSAGLVFIKDGSFLTNTIQRGITTNAGDAYRLRGVNDPYLEITSIVLPNTLYANSRGIGTRSGSAQPEITFYPSEVAAVKIASDAIAPVTAESISVGTVGLPFLNSYVSHWASVSNLFLGPAVKLLQGNLSPEGVYSANPQSLYFQTNQVSGIGLWLKTNGTGSSGWWLLTPGSGGGGGLSDGDKGDITVSSSASVWSIDAGVILSNLIAASAINSSKILDGTIAAADYADNSIAGTKIAFGSDAQGDLAYYNGTDWARLPAGTSGQLLQTPGPGSNPLWATVGTLTDADKGDIVVSGGGTVFTWDFPPPVTNRHTAPWMTLGSYTNRAGDSSGGIIVEDPGAVGEPAVWLTGAGGAGNIITYKPYINLGFLNRSLTLESNANRFYYANTPYGNFGVSNTYGLDGVYSSNGVFAKLHLPGLTASRAVILNSAGMAVSPSGTPDSTTFLRGDGAYAVPPGLSAPYGANNQIQFYQDGGLSASNELVWSRSGKYIKVTDNSQGVGAFLGFSYLYAESSQLGLGASNAAQWYVQGTSSGGYKAGGIYPSGVNGEGTIGSEHASVGKIGEVVARKVLTSITSNRVSTVAVASSQLIFYGTNQYSRANVTTDALLHFDGVQPGVRYLVGITNHANLITYSNSFSSFQWPKRQGRGPGPTLSNGVFFVEIFQQAAGDPTNAWDVAAPELDVVFGIGTAGDTNAAGTTLTIRSFLSVGTNGGTLVQATNLQFRGLVASNDASGIMSIHGSIGSGTTLTNDGLTNSTIFGLLNGTPTHVAVKTLKAGSNITLNNTGTNIEIVAASATLNGNLDTLRVTNQVLFPTRTIQAGTNGIAVADYSAGYNFHLILVTNTTLKLSNVVDGIASAPLQVTQGTNGQFTLTITNLNGLVRTNGSYSITTNAYATDLLHVSANLGTNAMISVVGASSLTLDATQFTGGAIKDGALQTNGVFYGDGAGNGLRYTNSSTGDFASFTDNGLYGSGGSTWSVGHWSGPSILFTTAGNTVEPGDNPRSSLGAANNPFNGIYGTNIFAEELIRSPTNHVTAELYAARATVTNTLTFIPQHFASSIAFRTNQLDLTAKGWNIFTNALSTNQVLQVTNLTVGSTATFSIYGQGIQGGTLTNAWNVLFTASAGTTIFWPQGVTNGNYDMLLNSNQVAQVTMFVPRSTNVFATYRILE